MVEKNENRSRKVKSYLAILLTAIIAVSLTVTGFVIIPLLFPRENTQGKVLLDLAQNYFQKQEYESAGLLCTAVLLDDPENAWALELHERIEAGRISMENNDAGLRTGFAGANESAAIMRRLDELDLIKRMLERIQAEKQQPQVVYQPVRETTPDVPKGNETASLQDENNLAVWLSKGTQAYNHGDRESAKKYFTQALGVDKDQPQANILLAAVLYEENPHDSGNLERVIQLSKRGLEKDPSNKTGYMTLGRAYESAGSNDLAIRNYLEVVRIDPTSHETHYRLGMLYYGQKDYESAENAFLKALALNKNIPLAFFYLGQIEKSRENREKSAEYFEEAVKGDAGMYSGFRELGELYFGMNEYKKAEDRFISAYAIRKDFFLAGRIGDCEREAGNPDAAASRYKEALSQYRLQSPEEKSRGARLYCFLAERAMRAGNMEAVARYLESARQLDASMETDPEYMALRKEQETK